MIWLLNTLILLLHYRQLKKGVLGFGQASDQFNFAPKAQLTATIDNWGPYYIRKVQVIDGNWETNDYFGHMNEGAVQMAPFTNMPADVAAEAQKIKDAISNGEYFAFTGPIKDNNGNLQLADGVVADDVHLNTMMYYVEGIDANGPRTINMIPVIDFQSETVLEKIREAYTTVGFAVFTNALSTIDRNIMNSWFDNMKDFLL